jgi:hypothetical protein
VWDTRAGACSATLAAGCAVHAAAACPDSSTHVRSRPPILLKCSQARAVKGDGSQVLTRPCGSSTMRAPDARTVARLPTLSAVCLIVAQEHCMLACGAQASLFFWLAGTLMCVQQDLAPLVTVFTFFTNLSAQ